MSINRDSLVGRSNTPTGPMSARLFSRLVSRLASDRGDVPGWVLITLMTAGIVVALWAVASEALVGLFEQAMSQFS